jgi:hypothetical protein
MTNDDKPALLTGESRLMLLESLLVSKIRNNEPVDDLIKAIEALRTIICGKRVSSTST